MAVRNEMKGPSFEVIDTTCLTAGEEQGQLGHLKVKVEKKESEGAEEREGSEAVSERGLAFLKKADVDLSLFFEEEASLLKEGKVEHLNPVCGRKRKKDKKSKKSDSVHCRVSVGVNGGHDSRRGKHCSGHVGIRWSW